MTEEKNVWAYSAAISARMQCPTPPDAMEMAERYFHSRALVEAFDKRIDDIFSVLRLGELPRRHRARYAAALGEIANYMQAAGFGASTTGEFIELALALYELDDGSVREFLKPATRKGRPRDAGDIWEARARVSVAVDLLVRSGTTRAEACKQLARQFAFLAPALSPSSNGGFATAIANWHSAFIDRAVSDTRAQGMFNHRDVWAGPGVTVEAVMTGAAIAAAFSASTATLNTSKSQHAKQFKRTPIKSGSGK